MVAVALASCSAEIGGDQPTSTSIPDPTVAPILDLDVALQMTATATRSDGTAIDLELRVHTPTAAEDTADSAAIRPQFMASACLDSVDPAAFVPEGWTFVLIDYSAVARDGSATWSPDALIGVLPAYNGTPLAGGGIIGDRSTSNGDAPACERDKAVLGFGDGTVIVGFEGDATSTTALSAWSQLRYGFAVLDGVTLTGCTSYVTQAALDVTLDASVNTDRECSIGAA